MAAVKKSLKSLMNEKSESIMNAVGFMTAYFRDNPHRFAAEYLNIKLKMFQKILLYIMMHMNYFMFTASRGIGKTYLVALFATIRCILYPGTKIVVASGTIKQASEVLLKITEDFCKLHDWGSANLRNEINWKETHIGQNDATITFKSGSFITVVTSNDNARSKRANIIIVDEFRMVDLKVIETVLRKFLSSPRAPAYLNKPEYSHLQERNKEFYMSSAWLKSHWSYKKLQTYFVNMLDDKRKYFVCALPYQMAIKEGLLMRDAVADEMSEDTFNPITWQTEMECLWYGSGENSFFDYDTLSARRKIKSTFYPLELYSKKDIPIPKLSPEEVRILSVDVALMSSKKNANDASSLIITSNIPVDNTSYSTNVVYMENHEGLTTDELGIIVMRTFYEYKCTDLVLDTNGVGLGVADFIVKDQYDPITGKTYKGFKCCNDETMADRCKIKDPNKNFWSVKATSQFNNDICILLRNGFLNNRIILPVDETTGDEFVKSKIKGFSRLTPSEQAMFKITYLQSSLMINELINLDHEIKNGKIKIIERSGMRKDRYSSLAYNFWVINEIERSKKPKNTNSKSIANMLAAQTKRAKNISVFN